MHAKLQPLNLLGASLFVLASLAYSPASAQSASTSPSNGPRYAPGTIYEPLSSLPGVTDVGKRVHTFLKILVPPTGSAPHKMGAPTPPYGGYFYETPASLACVYAVVAVNVGCNPNSSLPNSPYGSRAIAIVDAYDYPAATSDLTTFSSQMGLPAPTSSNFQVVYATGTQPPNGTGTGWDTEAALDIQYSHGLAPKALVYLVEAASPAFSDMFYAVSVASTLVANAGGGQVSMSWGSAEFSGETSWDSYMTTSKVIYFTSAGDAAGVNYPSASPNAVSVGGVGNSRSPSTGKFQGAVAWTSTGGGVSAYEPRPGWQTSIYSIVGAYRGTPDVSAVADPNTGVWVYNAYNGGWLIVGGTSVASPVMAAISNAAGHFAVSTAAEHSNMYSTLGTPGAGWTDVTSGWCQIYDGDLADQGWDLCTGIGTPYGLYYK